jgi:hypothetical protein
MRTVSRKLTVLVLLAAIAVLGGGALFLCGRGFKRSVPGHIVRWGLGEAGAKQTVNDLAEDIRREKDLAELQAWSVQTLARFRSGQLLTNGKPSYWSMGHVRLARQERPAFVTREWGLVNQWGEECPEISVRLSTNGEPECVVIAWYLHGIAAGASDYRISFEPWCYAQAKPGVYVYHLYK